MYGLSLSKLLQESVITHGEDKIRYSSGGIQSLEKLLRPENIRTFESLHNGIYCFLAFHPKIDNIVSDYIKIGSLGSDAGRQIMVLFIATSEMRTPKQVEKSDWDFGIELETSIHPAYEAVEILFPGKKVNLPGLVFFDRLSEPKNSVYLPLSEVESVSNLASLCRTIFTIANNSFNTSIDKRQDFAELFSVQLEKKRIRYERSQKTAFREWLVKIYNKVYDHRADIISVVSTFG